jgi:hypothetical protein
MATEPEWKLFENQIRKAFPDAKVTSGSGKTWSDGDGLTAELCLEAKRHKRVALDAWWGQTRRQAERYHKTPVLVIHRPPVELQFGKSINDEVLAVVPLDYLANLRNEVIELRKSNAKGYLQKGQRKQGCLGYFCDDLSCGC